MTTKKCPRCGWTLPLERFAVDRAKAAGVKSWCLHCDRERSREYWEANKDRIRARQRDYRRRRAAAKRSNETGDGE